MQGGLAYCSIITCNYGSYISAQRTCFKCPAGVTIRETAGKQQSGLSNALVCLDLVPAVQKTAII